MEREGFETLTQRYGDMREQVHQLSFSMELGQVCSPTEAV